MPRRFLLASCAVLLLGGCAATSPEGARVDAAAILELSRAEDRFRATLREFSRRQAAQDPLLKPYLGVIDDFWRAQVRCKIAETTELRIASDASANAAPRRRRSYFAGIGEVEVPIHAFEALSPDVVELGPAIVESRFTSVVISA